MLTRETLMNFKTDFEAAMKGLEEKYGYSIKMKNITYNSNQFSFKTEVFCGTNDDKERENFEKYCGLYGLEKSDYNRPFYHAGERKTYSIVGFNIKAPKFCVILKDSASGKTYRATEEYITDYKKHKEKTINDYND